MDASPKPTIRSSVFDDVYFSAEDGLAETRHVFLDGNGLPGAWTGRERFVIAETGFGTGLNFLSAFKLFRETAAPGQRLEFISFEQYPLSLAEMESALSHWLGDVFAGEFPALARVYPEKLTGTHVLDVAENASLTLIFEDVNTAMPGWNNAGVDCWFLDGFKPSSNPQMWSETVFAAMARNSNKGARFATFTAAGAVKRGLIAAGFEVNKVKGFGRKRDMLAGRYKGNLP